MKIKIEGHIAFDHYNEKFTWFPFKSTNDALYLDVGPYPIEVEVPDGFDPRAAQVEALKRQKQAVMADFQKRVTDIERQIAQLTALEAA